MTNLSRSGIISLFLAIIEYFSVVYGNENLAS